MNKFDEHFEFRLAQKKEVDQIMAFINRCWPKQTHILGINKPFFQYEFCYNDRVGFYVAIDKISRKIVAISGVYFYTANFEAGKSDISAGMFCADPTCKVPFIGTELMRRYFEDLNPRTFIAPGVNMSTSGQLLLRCLHQRADRMKHFYILNNDIEYKIAKITEKHPQSICQENQINLEEIYSIEEMYNRFNDAAFRQRRPYKDRWYINKRYFNHPYYKYKKFFAGDDTVIIGRELQINDSKIFRIIDILGCVDNIGRIGNNLRQLIQKNHYEYIDLYELGVNDTVINKAGFVERVENDINIIPNYFEPFVQENIEIYVQRLDEDCYCFKGDGDQDRPNFNN